EEYRAGFGRIGGPDPVSLRDFPARHRILPMVKFGTVVAAVALAAALGAAPQQPALWTVHAVRFATLPFKVSSLVANLPADERARTIDIAMMVWVLQGPDHR